MNHRPSYVGFAFGLGIVTATAALLAPIVLGLTLFREKLPLVGLAHELQWMAFASVCAALCMAWMGWRNRIISGLHCGGIYAILIGIWAAVLIIQR